MKTEEQINRILDKIDTSKPSKYFGMTYEQGIEESLLWVIEQIADDEFTPIAE